MNEKTFPIIAGFLALLLSVLLVFSMLGSSLQVPRNSSPVESSSQASGGSSSNSVGQSVQLPIPVPSEVNITQ